MCPRTFDVAYQSSKLKRVTADGSVFYVGRLFMNPTILPNSDLYRERRGRLGFITSTDTRHDSSIRLLSNGVRNTPAAYMMTVVTCRNKNHVTQ